MANTLGYYNPVFYAQEALIHLEKALGMASRVHRGYDAERRAFNKGDTINIRKPSTFTAASAPATAVDLAVKSVQISLDQWYEVKFALTDQELAYTSEQIIDEHIRPAAYALADNIDQALAALYAYVPWYHDINNVGSIDVTDVTDVRKVLVSNNVPMDAGMIHYMVDPALEADLLALAAFTQQQGAGDMGVMGQMRGTLGMKYGAEVFMNQNTPTHTAGAAADTAGAIAADTDAGATTITIDDLTDTQTVKAGDGFSIADHTQKYVFTEDGTVASNALTAIGIYPALAADVSEDDIVTLRVDSHVANLMFHRNAFALAVAPLPDRLPNELGAKVATVTDPKTGLSLRSRIYYIGNSSVVHVALDVLYGVKILDGNLAARACGQVV
jgi:hypothetical protein